MWLTYCAREVASCPLLPSCPPLLPVQDSPSRIPHGAREKSSLVRMMCLTRHHHHSPETLWGALWLEVEQERRTQREGMKALLGMEKAPRTRVLVMAWCSLVAVVHIVADVHKCLSLPRPPDPRRNAFARTHARTCTRTNPCTLSRQVGAPNPCTYHVK